MKIDLKKIDWWVAIPIAVIVLAIGFGIFYSIYHPSGSKSINTPSPSNVSSQTDKQIVAKEVYIPDFPLSIGNYWIYEGPIKWTEANTGEILQKTITWKMEIIDIVSQGYLVGVRLKGSPGDLDWYQEDLLPRDYIMIVYPEIGSFYLFADDDYSQKIFNDIKSGNSIDYNQFKENDLFLDFSSMDVGKSFGCTDEEVKNRSDHWYCWYVKKQVSINLKNILGNASVKNPKEYQIEFNTVGDTTVMGFTPEIGITSYAYKHHGTVAESNLKLTNYFIVRKSEYVEYVDKLQYGVLENEIDKNFEQSLRLKYSNRYIQYNQIFDNFDDAYNKINSPLWLDVGNYKIKIVLGNWDTPPNEDMGIKIFKNDEVIASTSSTGKTTNIWKISYNKYSHYFVQTWSGGSHCCQTVYPAHYGNEKINTDKEIFLGDTSLDGKNKNNFLVKNNNLYLYFYNSAFAYFHSCFACSGSMFFPDFMKFDTKSMRLVNARNDFGDLYQEMLNAYIEQVGNLKLVIKDEEAKKKLNRDWLQPLVNRLTYSLLSGISKDSAKKEFVEDYILFDGALPIDPDDWNYLASPKTEEESRFNAEAIKDEIIEIIRVE